MSRLLLMLLATTNAFARSPHEAGMDGAMSGLGLAILMGIPFVILIVIGWMKNLFTGDKKNLDETRPPVVPSAGNDVYEQVAQELENGGINKGLWTRLYAECDGDDNKTKAAYIKHRVSELVDNGRKP